MRREEENFFYIGGMRNPHRALKKMSILQDAGNDMVRLWNGLAKDLPQAMEAPSGVSWIDKSWKNEVSD